MYVNSKIGIYILEIRVYFTRHISTNRWVLLYLLNIQTYMAKIRTKPVKLLLYRHVGVDNFY